MKATALAVARANIALVKYWGNRDDQLRLPAAGSLSVTLAGLETRTTVTPGGASSDRLMINGEEVGPAGLARARRVMDAARALAGDPDLPMLVTSDNSFPTAAGLASSASGMAALAVATAGALELNLSKEQLSALARLGSGSACRSIFGGFVRWQPGERDDGEDSHGVQLFPADHWDLRVVVVVVADQQKAVSSADGMARTAATSPYHQAWLASATCDLAAARDAITARNLPALGQVAERSCLRMHANMAASEPPLVYLGPESWHVITEVRRLQGQGVPVFFTADAGPNIKVFCEAEQEADVAAAMGKVQGVKSIIHARVGEGAAIESRPSAPR